MPLVTGFLQNSGHLAHFYVNLFYLILFQVTTSIGSMATVRLHL